MPFLKKFKLLVIFVAHFYFLFLFNKNITLKKFRSFNFWPRLARLQSSEEYTFALKCCRKLCQLHGLRNVCFITSALIYWLGETDTTIHFGLDVRTELPLGHAWIEYDGQIYTTDLNFKGKSVYNFRKEPVTQ